MSKTKTIAVIGTGFRPTGEDRPPEPIEEQRSPGVRAVLYETEKSVFPSSPAAIEIVAQQYFETAARAVEDGCDAVFINTVGDYGLEKMRNQLAVPVVGAGESSIRLAKSMHDHFSIVTIWPPALRFIYERLFTDQNVDSSMVSVVHLSEDPAITTLDEEDNFVDRFRHCTIDSVRRFEQAVAELGQRRGGPIISGCTCMAPAIPQLQRRLGIPIIEPMTVGYCATELELLDTHRSPSDCRRFDS